MKDGRSRKMTNREWLKGLNDRKLAERIVGIAISLYKYRTCCDCRDEEYNEGCEDDVAEWLGTEHKDDTN